MINSHIIPAFYLEQFATRKRKSKPGRIWVYEKTKKPDERATRVQGRENGYFSYTEEDGSLNESFEQHLADLEGQCNDVLVAAKSDLFHWPPGAVDKLAFYATLLYSRATQRCDFSGQIDSSTHTEVERAAGDDEFLEKLVNDANSVVGRNLLTKDIIRRSITRVLVEAKTASARKKYFLSSLIYNTEYISAILRQKSVQVWHAIEGCEFVTSDNPLVTFFPLPNGEFHPGYGFGKNGVVAAFPLASRACITWGVPGGRSRTVGADIVAKVNETMIRLSDRYVYSKTRSEIVRERVNEYGGSVRYGKNALMPVGLKPPSVRQFIRRRFGLNAEA
jgi:hypothetical protein